MAPVQLAWRGCTGGDCGALPVGASFWCEDAGGCTCVVPAVPLGATGVLLEEVDVESGFDEWLLAAAGGTPVSTSWGLAAASRRARFQALSVERI